MLEVIADQVQARLALHEPALVTRLPSGSKTGRRSDIHKLFDSGYVGVSPDHKFLVSDRLRSDYSNGRSYYPLNGQEIVLPHVREDWPSREALEWRHDNVFRR